MLTMKNLFLLPTITRHRVLIALTMASVFWQASVAQTPWPNWRGPNGNGTAEAGNYPTSWSEDKNIAWKMALPGRGASTPIVLGENVYLTLGKEGTNTLLCVNQLGKTLWEKPFGKERPGKNAKASGSNSSPVADGKNVLPKSNRQYSSSPIVANGNLYCTREDGVTFVLADGVEPKVVSENRLDGNIVATPIFVDNSIYIRSFESLYCIR